MGPIESMFKKIKSIAQNGLEPYEIGKNNLETGDKEAEDKARDRATVCGDCDLITDEPIDMLKVKDTSIPILDSKMCGDCCCSLPYLLRQDLKICKKWQE